MSEDSKSPEHYARLCIEDAIAWTENAKGLLSQDSRNAVVVEILKHARAELDSAHHFILEAPKENK